MYRSIFRKYIYVFALHAAGETPPTFLFFVCFAAQKQDPDKALFFCLKDDISFSQNSSFWTASMLVVYLTVTLTLHEARGHLMCLPVLDFHWSVTLECGPRTRL